MKVAVCADMVGVSGIDRYEQCFPSWPEEYRRGVRMLVGDVRAAVDAALGAGADEVVLADWHHLGRNLPSAAFPGLPIRRLWEGGRPSVGPDGLGDPDVALILGCHAAAGNANGFVSHTVWMGMSVLLDGVPMPEAALWALALGGGGVPVALLSGDQRGVEECMPFLPGARTVATKAGTSRTAVLLRDADDAREELREAVSKALASPPAPLVHPFPAHATIVFGHERDARRAGKRGVGERTGPREVSARLGSVHDLMPFAFRAMLSTALGAGARLEDRLTPRGHGPGARTLGAGLLGATGWAERRMVRRWLEEPADLYPPAGEPISSS